MKQREDVAPGIALVSLILTLSLLEGLYFRSALDTMNQRTVHLINQIMAPLLLHTHRLNDDLTMQTAIQNLAQGTGVVFATVLDTNRHVMAHSDPSQLGQIFGSHLKHSTRSTYSMLTLKETTQPWGYFLFALSRRPLREKMTEHFGMLLGADILILLGMIWHWILWRKRSDQANIDFNEINQKFEESESQAKELRQQLKILIDSSTLRLQEALEYIPRAALLLDSAQRVLACNKAASKLLMTSNEQRPLSGSWQDIKWLENCGEPLQKSLDIPGQSVEVQPANSTATIQFLTLASPENNPAGTWVFLRDS